MTRREKSNALLLEGYSSVRPGLNDKEKIWFDKAMKLVEELGESDPKTSDRLMGLDCALVVGLSAAALNKFELAVLARGMAEVLGYIALAVLRKGAQNGSSYRN